MINIDWFKVKLENTKYLDYVAVKRAVSKI